LPVEQLLKHCEMRRGRRRGPGGQHRNKVETAVVVTHLPTGVRGEASERRSQLENRQQAVFRLRVNLALEIRCERRGCEKMGLAPSRNGENPGKLAVAKVPVPIFSQPRSDSMPLSELWRSRCSGGKIPVSPIHQDFPALLAEALDVLAACDMHLATAAPLLQVTASQLTRFLKLEPRALQLVNDRRRSAGHPPLR
jgi:hypothetical protein